MLGLRALLCAVAPGALAGMYGQPVVNLDGKTFKQALSVEHAAMVAFVAPWCGHCKALGPEYTAAAASLSPLIPFYAVDCDDAGNKRLCAEYQIQGFPTIKAFPRALKGAARDYQGERKTGAMVEFAKGLVPDRVKKLRAEDEASAKEALGKFLAEKPNLPHTVLIHPSTPSIPFLWKVLGHRLSSKMHLAYIKDTASHAVISSLGIYNPEDTSRDNTRAVFWPAGASLTQGVEYDGGFKFNALLEWLQALIDGKTPPPPTGGDLESAKQKPIRADPPPSSSSSSSSAQKEADTAARQAELERKARLRAKMEEAEKRDAARRARLAAKSAAAAAGTHAAGSAQGSGEEPSRVEDAPRPEAEEGVQEEILEGQSSAQGVVPLDPEPEQGAEDLGEDQAQASETIIHEEL